ncbi:MAG: DUF488 family protein, partial [Dehalococcoidia bacterium]
TQGTPEIFSVGHSNQTLRQLIGLLKHHAIQAVVDTRSYPVSKFASQFNRSVLEQVVPQHSIRYVFRGAELGGRPRGDEYYDAEGHVIYSRVAQADFFLDGINRLERGICKYRITLLCSEENPEHCHRRLLIGRVLAGRGVSMTHIRGDGRLEVEPPHDFGRRTGGSQHLALFRIDEDSEWRSTRSVLQRSPQASSSAH